MKSPIRSSKTAAPVTTAKSGPAPKLAIANMPYNASDKKAINQNNTPKKPADQQAAARKKQAAAQES